MDKKFVGEKSVAGKADGRLIVYDMVHHNPGEPRFEVENEDPRIVARKGFDGKVYFIFDSPTLAIDWREVTADLFPAGSVARVWVDELAAKIRSQLRACKDAGLEVLAQADLLLFPANLIERLGLEGEFTDPRNSRVQRLLQAMVRQCVADFPDLDGFVFRIGETYLHDAPYHKGGIRDKSDVEGTIIPLLQLLREELCERARKRLIFRAWISFDENEEAYLRVSEAVEPHPLLQISIKHCEQDFHRGNRFSRVIGLGRHRQLVEVQCAREYEGKGAYPNYFAHGVIDGFEEHADMPSDQIRCLRDFQKLRPDLCFGIWTWCIGGGWAGPYVANRFWPELNSSILVAWAKNPMRTEEEIFQEYARQALGLDSEDVILFRHLCLLSARAILRGRNSTESVMDVWWTRDQGIGWPKILGDEAARQRNLVEKREAVAMWQKIVDLSKQIQWSDKATAEFIAASSQYGLRLYRIYQAVVEAEDAAYRQDAAALVAALAAYDKAWEDYEHLPEEFDSCASLYERNYDRWFAEAGYETAEAVITRLKQSIMIDV